jgi:hypothetical protein
MHGAVLGLVGIPYLDPGRAGVAAGQKTKRKRGRQHRTHDFQRTESVSKAASRHIHVSSGAETLHDPDSRRRDRSDTGEAVGKDYLLPHREARQRPVEAEGNGDRSG